MVPLLSGFCRGRCPSLERNGQEMGKKSHDWSTSRLSGDAHRASDSMILMCRYVPCSPQETTGQLPLYFGDGSARQRMELRFSMMETSNWRTYHGKALQGSC